LDPGFLFWPQEAAVDAAANGVEEIQPVLQRRLRDWLPLVVAALAGEETPLTAYVLHINLER